MSTLKNRLQAQEYKNTLEQVIAAKLATGKFTDTGAKYSPEQAVADHKNTDLRLTANIDSNNRLVWSK